MSLPSTGAGTSTTTSTNSIYVTRYAASQYAEFNRTRHSWTGLIKKLSQWNTLEIWPMDGSTTHISRAGNAELKSQITESTKESDDTAWCRNTRPFNECCIATSPPGPIPNRTRPRDLHTCYVVGTFGRDLFIVLLKDLLTSSHDIKTGRTVWPSANVSLW